MRDGTKRRFSFLTVGTQCRTSVDHSGEVVDVSLHVSTCLIDTDLPTPPAIRGLLLLLLLLPDRVRRSCFLSLLFLFT